MPHLSKLIADVVYAHDKSLRDCIKRVHLKLDGFSGEFDGLVRVASMILWAISLYSSSDILLLLFRFFDQMKYLVFFLFQQVDRDIQQFIQPFPSQERVDGFLHGFFDVVLRQCVDDCAMFILFLGNAFLQKLGCRNMASYNNQSGNAFATIAYNFARR